MTVHQTITAANPYALADWRRLINDLYSRVRETQDPQAAHVLWLSERSRLFREHPMSPLPASLRAGFGAIDCFAYDLALRFSVQLDPIEGGALDYALGRDGSMTCRPIAETRGLGQSLGKELTVYWITGYGGGLFIPFKDATSGTETYGGGRYLVDAIKGSDLGLDAQGRLILDFNFAYNPSCSMSPDFVCPLAPEENRLPQPVRAGEKAP